MRLATALAATTAALAITVAFVVGGDSQRKDQASLASPQIVTIAPGSLTYRLPGEFLRADKPVDAPGGSIAFTRSLDIMKHQVDSADYARCVAEQACEPADGRVTPGLPVTGIGFEDARAYAIWLSERTGESWRLPTDAEWAFAAAERFSDEPLALDDNGANPAVRWLARYRKEASQAVTDGAPVPHGSFGTNSKGLSDVAGNVWEWTSTCFVRTALDAADVRTVENCGVRIAGGRHRAYTSFFLRDGKSGGCAAGMAPQNLGVRLVRDRPSLLARINARLQRLLG